MAFNRRGPRRGDRGNRRDPTDWQPRERPPRDRDRDRDRGFAPRRFERREDGGMSLSLDPRRLSSLKRLAAEAGLRPGELARHWIEERIDAERSGGGAPAGARGPAAAAGLDEIRARLDQLASRLARLEAATPRKGSEPVAIQVAAPETTPGEAESAETPPRRRPGRPRKTPMTLGEGDGRQPRVGLHEEIIAVVTERGPSTAAEIAAAILERGRYRPPRSDKPLDAAMVNSRVSNPVYRSRFVRSNGRIGLAERPPVD